MLLVEYHHPLHGIQILRPSRLSHYISSESGKPYLKAENIHGVTFQLLEPERIKSIEALTEGAS